VSTDIGAVAGTDSGAMIGKGISELIVGSGGALAGDGWCAGISAFVGLSADAAVGAEVCTVVLVVLDCIRDSGVGSGVPSILPSSPRPVPLPAQGLGVARTSTQKMSSASGLQRRPLWLASAPWWRAWIGAP
jgi:hypothetical protein